MQGGWYANDVYGFGPSPQPTASPNPDHAPGPEPMARTVPVPKGLRGNTTLLLVAMLGVAMVLVSRVR
jgi:hypothetical protein